MILSIPHTGTHFLLAYLGGMGINDKYRHVDRRDNVTKRIVGDSPVITPIRDPAMNMLSHWQRGARGIYGQLAEDWRYLFAEFQPHYVPLDNGADYATRINYLLDACEHLGIEPVMKFTIDFALQWAPETTKGPSEEKRIYGENGGLPNDIRKALDGMKDLWPHFAVLGYKRFSWVN